MTEAAFPDPGHTGRAWRRGAVMSLGMVVAVSACIPARFSGFRPIGPGTIESSDCTAGTRDLLKVDAPSGVVLYFWAGAVALKQNDRPIGTALEPDVRMTVPTGTTARLTSPVIRVTSPEWTAPRDLEVAGISAPGPRRFGATDALPGSSAGSAGWFYLDIGLPGLGMASRYGLPAPTRFTLVMPPLEINGEEFEVAPVTFASYAAWGVYTCIQ